MSDDQPATLGELVAKAADRQSVEAANNKTDATHSDVSAGSETVVSESGNREGGDVPGAATSAALGISQSVSADAIERVRQRVSNETNAMYRAFSTPWNAR